MASKITENNYQYALSQLALRLTEGVNETVGSAPDEAELAAFYENRLDQKRRTEIMSYIANNPDIYQQWIRFVEAMSFVAESENVMEASERKTDIPESAQRQVSWAEKIKDFLGLNGPLVFGGGFATAMVLVIAFLVVPTQEQAVNLSLDVDRAYSQWGSALQVEWETLPNVHKPKPQLDNRSMKLFGAEKSEFKRVIETGFQQGSKNIPDFPYENFNLKPSSFQPIDVSQLTVIRLEQFDLLRNVGKLSALFALQCVVDPASPRINEIYPATQEIINQLSFLDSDESRLLTQNIHSKASHATTTCLLVKNTLQLLRPE